MDQHHIEVAEGTELAPSVTAHRYQGQASLIAPGGLVEQPAQPVVGGGCVGLAERVALQVGLVDQLLTTEAEGHRPTVPLQCWSQPGPIRWGHVR